MTIGTHFIDELEKIAKSVGGENTRDFHIPEYSRLRSGLRSVAAGLGHGILGGVTGGLGGAALGQGYINAADALGDPVHPVDHDDARVSGGVLGGVTGGIVGQQHGRAAGALKSMKNQARELGIDVKGLKGNKLRTFGRGMAQDVASLPLSLMTGGLSGLVTAPHAPAASAKNQLLEHALRTGQIGGGVQRRAAGRVGGLRGIM